MAQLSIDVKARTAQFQDGMNRVKRQSQGVIRDLNSGFSGLRATFLALGGAALFTGLVASLKSVTNELDGLAKAAQGAGVTVEELSALRYAAEFAGVGVAELDKSLAILGRRLEDAKDGSAEVSRAFDKLNLDPQQFNDSAELIKVLADRFQDLPDGAQKSAIAMQLFGRSGANLIPLLNSGAEGLEQMRIEAERLGLVFDTETAKAAEQLNDNLARLGKIMSGFTAQLFGPIINNLAQMTEAFRKATVEGKTFVDALIIAFATPQLASVYAQIAEIELSIEQLREGLKNTGTDTAAGIGIAQVIESELLDLEKLKDRANELLEIRKKYYSYEEFPSAGANRFNLEDPTFNPDQDAGIKRQISDGEKLIAQLRDRLNATQELNEVQRTGIELANQNIDGADAAAAIDLARRIDAQRQLNTELEAQRDLNNLIADAQGRAAERLASEIEGYKDLANPFRQTYFEIQRIQELASKGLLPPDVADGAIEALTKTNAEAEKLQSNLNESNELSKDFWLSFQSGAEDAIFAGEKLSDVISALIEDFGRLAFRAALQQLGTSLGIGVATGAAPAAGGGASTGGVVVQDGLKIPKATGLQTTAVTNNYYIPAAVSMTEVEGAIARGNARTKGDIYDSKQRGGVFA